MEQQGRDSTGTLGLPCRYLSHCCPSRLSHGLLQLAQQLAAVTHMALAWSLSSPHFWSQYQLLSLKHGCEMRISSSVAGIWGIWVPSLSSLMYVNIMQPVGMPYGDHSVHLVPVSGSEGSKTLSWVLQLCCPCSPNHCLWNTRGF